MLKHFLALLALSLIIMLTLSYCHTGLQGLVSFHNLLISILDNVFAGGKAALLIKDLIALLVIPLGVALIIGGVYWGIRKSQMPYLYHIIWTIWLVLITALICKHA